MTIYVAQMEDAEDNEWTETRLTGYAIIRPFVSVIPLDCLIWFRSDGRLASESNDVEDIDEDETPAGVHFFSRLRCLYLNHGEAGRASAIPALWRILTFFNISAKVGPPATSPAAGGDGRAMVVDGEDDSDVPDLDDLELEEGDDVIPADPAS